MNRMMSITIAALGAASLAPAAAAVDVYATSSGYEEVDSAFVASMADHGHDVFIGVEPGDFDDSVDLTGYGAVILLANTSYDDISESGQWVLREFVEFAGGGLITTEWMIWEMGDDPFANGWSILAPLMPVEPTSDYDYFEPITYTRDEHDPQMGAGLSQSFTFFGGYDGGDTFLVAKSDARAFFASSSGYDGVVGWDYEAGRVLCISTVVGEENVDHPKYSRLLSNALVWVASRNKGEGKGDRFGRDVDVIGDVNDDGYDDFVVASPQNDAAGNNAGRVYVYSGADQTLLYKRNGKNAGDRFGSSVAAAGDVDDDGTPDFIVGAPWNDHNGNNAGEVRVYSGSDGDLLSIKRGQHGGDKFGYAVAGGIDLDDDGHDDFLVGAPWHGNAGAVYAYSGRTGQQLSKLTGQGNGDRFGSAIAAVGRMNGNAFDDFVVGAPYHDGNGNKSGKIYAYDGGSFSTLHTRKGWSAGDRLGAALAPAGRVDNDNYDDYIVGSPFADKNWRNDVGRIDVLDGRHGEKIWTMRGHEPGSRIGTAVSALPDFNGDDVSEIMAGGPRYAGSGNKIGRVVIRDGAGGTALEAVNGEHNGDQLGFALAAGSGNGGEHFIVLAAPTNDFVDTNAGRIYVYPYSTNENAASGPLFGTPREIEEPKGDGGSSGCPGDLNGDHVVDGIDVVEVLARWGACDGCPADLTGDGLVDLADLLAIIDAFGACD